MKKDCMAGLLTRSGYGRLPGFPQWQNVVVVRDTLLELTAAGLFRIYT